MLLKPTSAVPVWKKQCSLTIKSANLTNLIGNCQMPFYAMRSWLLKPQSGKSYKLISKSLSLQT